jgi:hypothetical protein
MTVSGILSTRKEEQQICAQQKLPMPDQILVQQWHENCPFKFNASFVSMTKLYAINGDLQTNWLKSEMYLRA